ncbi:MAG TPA: hypothetical protein VGP46_09595 [Acidimicrobiales bacterium]|jgi:hypothetical protein|nr:hypothetical protein [Acidimicrobiales bacterium]
MGAMIGFLVGYFLGVKAGPKGYEELREAWQVISTSDEVKDLVSGGMTIVKELARQGGSIVIGRLGEPESAGRKAA